jgi:hypothetical protein
MPTSIDPEPAENEIECARCGAHFYYELSRCPECGVNIYEPDEGSGPYYPVRSSSHTSRHHSLGDRFKHFVQRITRKP